MSSVELAGLQIREAGAQRDTDWVLVLETPGSLPSTPTPPPRQRWLWRHTAQTLLWGWQGHPRTAGSLPRNAIPPEPKSTF